MRRLIAAVAALAVVLVAPLIAAAQPLTDRIPKDAIIYVGWKGADQLGPGYDASHLKAVLDASGVGAFFNEFLPKLAERAGQENPQAGQVFAVLSAIGSPLWKHPSALYVGPIDFAAPPMPHAALLCDAGPDAAALLNTINQILAMVPQGPVPLVAKQYKGVVAIIVGEIDPTFEGFLQAGGNQDPSASTLRNSLAFQSVMKQVTPDPVFTAYADVEAMVGLVDSVVSIGDDRNAKVQWPKIRDALGIQGLKRVVVTSGFDGKDWGDQIFIQAPAPRSGLVGMMDTTPLSDDILKTVPRTATLASAGKLGLAKIYAAIHDGIKEFNADAGAQADAVMDQINQGIGVNIEKDVLGSLGDEWVLYSDPIVTGTNGFAVVNHLAKPDIAEKSFTAVETVLNSLIHDNIPDKRVNIAFQQTKVDDLTIHYLDIPLITPSWAIRDGNLYLALYPQVVESAAKYVAGKGPSLLENPDFTALRARLGGEKATAIEFMDLPKTAPLGYAGWLAISRLAAVGDVFGVQSPPMLLPPLYKIMPQLAPAGGVTWVDDAGWHARDVSPFPGSTLLASDAGLAIAAPALMTSIMLPSLNRARETSNRVKSASNLRQIGQGCMLYANENNGKYPPDLGTLLKTEDLTVDAFVSPESGTKLPPELSGQKSDEQAAWVNQNSDYVYLGAGKNNATPADSIIAYEKLHLRGGQGVNILFGDGHVDFEPGSEAQRLLAAQGVEPKE
jgi:prepilin-type processing-associated H-X9-DG protein